MAISSTPGDSKARAGLGGPTPEDMGGLAFSRAGQAHPIPGTAATFCSRRKIQNTNPAAGVSQPLALTPSWATAAAGRKARLQAALCPAKHCKTDLY